MLRAMFRRWFGRGVRADADSLEHADRLLAAGDPAAALACYDRLERTATDTVAIGNGRAAALLDLWRVDEAVAAYAEAHARSGAPASHSAWLLHRHYSAEQGPHALAAAHRAFGERFPAPSMPAMIEPSPERKLRIGYLSPHFSRHSVGNCIEPVLQHHDRAAFDITCYSLHPQADDATVRMRWLADHWTDAAGLSDAELEQCIRDDGIDILIDLAGHSALNRLALMATRPAPVQVTWLGYPDTTGLMTMDYRLTDPIADPVDQTDPLHTETLIRLPGVFLCYRPPADAPPVSTISRDTVTFGSFNNLDQLSSATLALWSSVLTAVPGSRLLLKSSRFRFSATKERLIEAFTAHGIAAERLQLEAWCDERRAHLAAYAEIDIALDTFPCNGRTTTCEALWMGVPVVTRAGAVHRSRLGASLLSQVGLLDLIADSDAGFVAAAAALARDAPQRRLLRATLRDRMATAPLRNERLFTQRLEEALRGVWRTWCDRSEERTQGVDL